jgi:intracellular multiplication protein IcmD
MFNFFKGPQKKLRASQISFLLFALGTSSLVFASASSGIGGIATNISGSLSAVASLIGGAAYLAGLVFAVAGIIQFKAHKDNPQQVPLSKGVVLVAVGASLLFLPSLLSSAGSTLFGSSGTSAGTTGSGLSTLK